MRKYKENKILNLIKGHVLKNKKEYIVIFLFFIVGIFLGVFFVNNMQEGQKLEMGNYLDGFNEKLKSTENLNFGELLRNSIGQNLLLAFIIWFFGTTVIGIPIVFGMILYRGFCLGYTISITIVSMGVSKGFIFILVSLLLQSILFIPAIIALAVSGFKLYKSIIKDKNKENIKIEVVRHTVFSLIMSIILVLSSVIEIFISTNILKQIVKYF